jgi:hypothetical protein
MRLLRFACERPPVERGLAEIHGSSVPVGYPEDDAVSPVSRRGVLVQHDVVHAQEAQRDTELVLGCLHGRRVRGVAPEVLERHEPLLVRLHHSSRRFGSHSAEVHAFGEAHQVPGETIAAHVAAFPDVRSLRKRSGDGPAVAGAASVMLPVRAYEKERMSQRISKSPPPIPDERLDIETEELVRIPYLERGEPPLPPAGERGKAASRGRSRSISSLDEEGPHAEMFFPCQELSPDLARKPTLEESLVAPGARLLHHHPVPQAGRAAGERFARRRCDHRAPWRLAHRCPGASRAPSRINRRTRTRPDSASRSPSSEAVKPSFERAM